MQNENEPIALVVHGGAGTIRRENLTPEREAQTQESLAAALRAGHAILTEGGSGVDAVEAAVRVLEDDPFFNAGRGAVFTADGRNVLDAAIMDGATRRAGAVAGVTLPRNPVTLARAVMERSQHVLLIGAGADDFAREMRVELAERGYFHTDERWQQLVRQRDAATVSLSEDNKFGTVGAVARDRNGHLAAATSTGGMTNQRWGRVGDAPIVGAGTWADDATCAVSATGHGEFFLRCAVAHDIAARIAYAGQSLAAAAAAVVHETLVAIGGAGGVIGLDRHGNAALPFNTSGMYRGFITESGRIETAIYARQPDSK